MRVNRFLVVLIMFLLLSSMAQAKSILIDDFENELKGGQEGTVDYGAGAGSTIEVAAATDIKYSGKQSLKVSFDAINDGYMWVARGFDLDVKNAVWLVDPRTIDWAKVKSISFYIYGSDSKTKIAFDIKDNGNEMWRFMVEDDFKGWKKTVCPLNGFFARTDWQPDTADKNAALDLPLKSFQFEPRPAAKGMLYFDDVELIDE
jgi:hypothetical protein